MKLPVLRLPAVYFLPVLIVLALAGLALYGPFLSNPLVFDDFNYFGDKNADALKSMSAFALRGLPIASFGWVRTLAGDAVIW